MKKKFGKSIFLMIAVVTLLAVLLCACGSDSSSSSESGSDSDTESAAAVGSASESDFEWDGDVITGISDEGVEKTALVIPARCTEIAELLNWDDAATETLTFESDDDITLNYGSFFNSTTLKSVVLPDGLTVIPDSAFSYCTALESVEFPTALETMENDAFSGCESLTTLDLSACTSLKELPENAFAYCTSLTSISLPDSIETINKHAMHKTALKELRLPASLTEMVGIDQISDVLEDVYVPEEVDITAFAGSQFMGETDVVRFHVTEGSASDTGFDEWAYDYFEKVYD